MAQLFNPDKPHDLVHGPDELGRRYFQGGRYFDAQGNEVADPQDKPAPTRGRPRKQAEPEPARPTEAPTATIDPTDIVEDLGGEPGEDVGAGAHDPDDQLALQLGG